MLCLGQCLQPTLTPSPLCLSFLCTPGQPTWSPWTPWSECSASCGPARRHRHRFCSGPPTMDPSVLALPSPPTWPTPLCPGPDAEEEPCLLPGCDRESPGAQDGALHALGIPTVLYRLALRGPTPPPQELLPLLSSQELGAGGLGGPGPAVAGAVGEACGAGCEPVISLHPRAWGITARGLGPKERPARLCRAQVPARMGGQGARSTLDKWTEVDHPHSSQPLLSFPQ